MQSGKLRKRVTIQERTETKNNFAEAVEGFAAVGSAWASITPMTGKEPYSADKPSPDVTHEIRLRYNPGLLITPAHRLLCGARIFDVKSVRNVDERNREIAIAAKESV